MEYALGELMAQRSAKMLSLVLILVVMEYALGEQNQQPFKYNTHECLNPCCDGICSRSPSTSKQGEILRRLNPCCDGICSRSLDKCQQTNKSINVLILVVMEYALGANSAAANLPE